MEGRILEYRKPSRTERSLRNFFRLIEWEGRYALVPAGGAARGAAEEQRARQRGPGVRVQPHAQRHAPRAVRAQPHVARAQVHRREAVRIALQ